MIRTLRRPQAPAPGRPPAAPLSLADKVFPAQPSLAARAQALSERTAAAVAARLAQRPAAKRAGLPRPAAFWGRVGAQQLRRQPRELSWGLRLSGWLTGLWHRAFVKFVRWSWSQRHSRLFGFAWRAVRKSLQAEVAQMGHSFKLLGGAFVLWQKAALKAAWWDLRRKLPLWR